MIPLTPALVEFLLGAPAQEALDALAGEALEGDAELGLLLRLRRTWTPDQAAALLDQARLRRKAGDKFPQAAPLLFTEDALQQASSREVARYRAHSLAGALPRGAWVADLGCGLGADSIALAEAGLHVLAVERDPVRARLAAANVERLGLAGQVEVVQAEWRADTLPELFGPRPVQATFVDPSRRSGNRRIFRVSEMEPPLDAVLAVLDHCPALAVKTLPGIADEDIPPAAQVEFISERGAMKEALLRFGPLRSEAARVATLLPGPNHLTDEVIPAPPAISEPLAWLYEPDSAVIRATLVHQLAAELSASQLDPTIAYLTAGEPRPTPFARRWRVARHGPFHLKTLNSWLRELQPGEIIVKKRGSAIDPDDFRRRLQTTPGGPPLTVFLTRVRGKPWMICAQSWEPQS